LPRPKFERHLCLAKNPSGYEIHSYKFLNPPIRYDCSYVPLSPASGWEQIFNDKTASENLTLSQRLGVFKRRNGRPRLTVLKKYL